MIDAVLAKVFGTKNEREVKAMLPIVAAINDLEPAMQALSDIDVLPVWALLLSAQLPVICVCRGFAAQHP